ncbi:MAG: hypothetical protein GX621_17585 [Pirellulaceae bacterium]|nr:hypothetical protein [Pirellulaceae bacterium]
MSGILSQITALLVLLNLVAACLARANSARRRPVGRVWLLLATAVAGLLLFLVKIDGLSAVDLVLSLSPTLSVLTCGLMLHGYSEKVFGRPLLATRELTLWAGFVLCVSVPLFASVLGFIPIDLYAQGYLSSWVYLIPVGFGACAAWRGCFGLAGIMLGVLAAKLAGLIPTENLFDAMTDGIAFVLAVVIGVQHAAGFVKRRRKPNVTSCQT